MRANYPQAFAAMAVIALVSVACADAPVSGPQLDSPPPQFNFTNGPDDLPNVFRIEDVQFASITDLGTDLRVYVGLPENPLDFLGCGGSAAPDLHAYQIGGVLSGVLHLLAKADVHLHVYRRSTFTSICSSTLLAQGTGRVVVTDNDVLVTGTRVNSFGASVTGDVTLAPGETARLTAHTRLLIFPGRQLQGRLSRLNGE